MALISSGTSPKRIQITVSYSSVVAVELCDTSGDVDLNINKYLLDFVDKCNSQAGEFM